jgi:hypothetical protein
MTPAPQEQFKIPRELQRRPPRSVRRKPGTLGCSILIARLVGLALLCVGILLLCYIPITIAVVTRGESHPGQVQKTWTTRGKRGSINYHLQFSYEAGGQIHTATRSLSKDQFNRISTSLTTTQPAPPLDVRALSLSGHYFQESFLPGESLWSPIWFAIFIATIENIIAWLVLYFVWIVAWRQKILCRQGQPIPGHIVRKHTTKGKTTSYYLDYQFDHPGLGLRTATLFVNPDRWRQAHVGEPVTVLCYPSRKRPTVMYEYCDIECV